MKIKCLLLSVLLTLSAGIAFAGAVISAPVVVDLDNQIAFGDQLSARTAPDDVSLIGCGVRNFDDGMGFAFRFGFCQATDTDGNTIFCSTETPSLIDQMNAHNSYSFITFAWQDDGTCMSVGFSTQSFYLPDPGGDNDDDSDSDSD